MSLTKVEFPVALQGRCTVACFCFVVPLPKLTASPPGALRAIARGYKFVSGVKGEGGGYILGLRCVCVRGGSG